MLPWERPFSNLSHTCTPAGQPSSHNVLDHHVDHDNNRAADHDILDVPTHRADHSFFDIVDVHPPLTTTSTPPTTPSTGVEPTTSTTAPTTSTDPTVTTATERGRGSIDVDLLARGGSNTRSHDRHRCRCRCNTSASRSPGALTGGCRYAAVSCSRWNRNGRRRTPIGMALLTSPARRSELPIGDVLNSARNPCDVIGGSWPRRHRKTTSCKADQRITADRWWARVAISRGGRRNHPPPSLSRCARAARLLHDEADAEGADATGASLIVNSTAAADSELFEAL